MNFCNFAKIIIARSSKDPKSLEWWQSTEKEKSTQPTLSNFSNLTSVTQRYEFYTKVMQRYPKMYISAKSFSSNLPRLQNYITQSKYWKNGNKHGERSTFIKRFSLENWYFLPVNEKNMHQLQDCTKCESSDPNVSSTHASVSESTENIIVKTKELANELKNLHSQRLTEGSKQLVKILEPIFENTFHTSLKNTVTTHFNLVDKISSNEKQKKKLQSSRESTQTITNLISNDENEIDSFLASGLSYSHRERERMSTFFETPKAAKLRTESIAKEVKSGKRKEKKHVGKLSNYTYDKAGFKKFITAQPKDAKISWRAMAIKFNVLNKEGLRPSNAGQVLLEVAKTLGVNTDQFNTSIRVSGRDYRQRVRRARHKLLYKAISIPTPRPTRHLHREIRRRLNNRELYVGEKIAPKVIKKNKITAAGQLQDTDVTVYGRKIPLDDIRHQMNEDQAELFRGSNQDYDQMSRDTVTQKLQALHMEVPDDLQEAKETIKRVEWSRNLKLWHDHSDILNHSYVCFMISALYDPAVYLTNDEYTVKYPNRPPIDVQSVVERPYLYILGQSKSSDLDQLSYIQTRLEDLRLINKPTIQKGMTVYDTLRVFSGDGPARQFEAGQQRGGTFSCLCGVSVKDHQNLECAYRCYPPSLLERNRIFRAGELWQNFTDTNISPFVNLKKESLIDELEARGINTDGMNKSEMQEELSSVLHGIQRPPALLKDNDDISYISKYEILACEPLHDITNVVQNIINELPSHINNKSTQTEFEKFSAATIGDKNQLKGSDARLYAVKLAKFVNVKYMEKKVTTDIVNLCSSLVDIIAICYSTSDERTPKKILRLFNQCFIFSLLCKKVIGNPQKMTSRRFYGCHFHSLTVHAPQSYRLFCLRSLVPEEEERAFGDLRRISLNTSNRQCGKVIDNAILRYNAQNHGHKTDSYRKQESAISQQARLLPVAGDSEIPLEVLKSRPYLMQTHCERIADFLVEGQNHWWSLGKDSIVFHDGPKHPEQSSDYFQHFRKNSTEDTREMLKITWNKCLDSFDRKEIQLPLLKIKMFKGSKTTIARNEDLLQVPPLPVNTITEDAQDQAPDDVMDDDVVHHTAETISEESFPVGNNGIHSGQEDGRQQKCLSEDAGSLPYPRSDGQHT